MKRYTLKWVVLSALLGAFGVSGNAQALPIVRLVASAILLNPNDLVTVSILVEQLGDGSAPSIGAWDLDITLTDGNGGTAPQSAIYGTPDLHNEMNPNGGITIQDPPVLGATNVDLGQVSDGGVTIADLNNDQSGSFILAQVVYQMGGLPGVSVLELCTPSLPDCVLGDAAGGNLPFDIEPLDGLVLEVLPVLPEPGLALVLGLPLVLLAARRRVASH